jgi:hypothetical protein
VRIRFQGERHLGKSERLHTDGAIVRDGGALYVNGSLSSSNAANNAGGGASSAETPVLSTLDDAALACGVCYCGPRRVPLLIRSDLDRHLVLPRAVRDDPTWEYKKRAREGCGQLCVRRRRVSTNPISVIGLWDIGVGRRARRIRSGRAENASLEERSKRRVFTFTLHFRSFSQSAVIAGSWRCRGDVRSAESVISSRIVHEKQGERSQCRRSLAA